MEINNLSVDDLMPRVEDIISSLEGFAPPEYKEAWDNVGLLTGSPKAKVTGILFSLDVTEAVICEAVNLGYNMIVTHHPLILEPIKKITDESVTGDLIMGLIKNDINLYCMHTNLDKAIGGVNDKLAELLELSDVKALEGGGDVGIGRIGILPHAMPLNEFAQYVRDVLDAPAVKYLGDPERSVKIVAVVSGSGGGYFESVIREGADVFVSAEIKHHTAIAANDLNLAIIDAGHFETETIIMEELADVVASAFSIPLAVSRIHRPLFRNI